MIVSLFGSIVLYHDIFLMFVSKNNELYVGVWIFDCNGQTNVIVVVSALPY